MKLKMLRISFTLQKHRMESQVYSTNYTINILMVVTMEITSTRDI